GTEQAEPLFSVVRVSTNHHLPSIWLALHNLMRQETQDFTFLKDLKMIEPFMLVSEDTDQCE
ncbi:MAG: hypothetical protein QM687_11805, partial [Ferruginibacter sp.]